MTAGEAAERCLPPRLLALWRRALRSEVVRRLVRGSAWNLAGTVAARALSVAASVAVARILGREGFGELGMVTGTVLNLSIFTGYGLGVTATKHVAELRRSDPERAGRILALAGSVSAAVAGLLSLLLLLLAGPVAERVLGAPALAGPLRAGAVMLFFTLQNGAQMGALAGFEAFRASARVNLLGGVAMVGATVAGVVVDGVFGAVCGMAGASALTWALAHSAIREAARETGVPLSARGAASEFRVLRDFSLPSILGSVLFGPVSWGCSAVLVNGPGGYAAMGQFNATNQWFAFVMFLPAIFGQVVLPILSGAMGDGDAKEADRTLGTVVKASAAVAIPLGALLAVASPHIMSFYGPGFREAWPALAVSVATAAVLAVQSPLVEYLNASARPWAVVRANLLWAGAALPLTVLLSAPYGVLGFVTARLVAFAAKGAYLAFAVRPSRLVAPRREAPSSDLVSPLTRLARRVAKISVFRSGGRNDGNGLGAGCVKVLFVTSASPRADDLNMNYHQRVHFLSREFRLTVLASHGSDYSGVAAAETEIVRAARPGKAAQFAACLGMLRDRRRSFDVVLTEPSSLLLCGFLWKTLHGTPWVVDVWDIPIRSAGARSGAGVKARIAMTRSLARWSFRAADLFLVSIAPRLELRSFGIPPEKVLHLPNAIWPCSVPAMEGVDDLPGDRRGVFEIICLRSSHMPDMGLDLLAEAFLRIAKERLCVRIRIVGEIPPETQDQVALLRGRGDVVFEPNLPHGDLMRRIRDAGACVVPFRDVPDLSQTYPIKVIEAIDVGAPLVASDLEGIRSIVRDGENGLLFRAGDSLDLERAIRLLMDDPAVGDRFRRRAAAGDDRFDCRRKNLRIVHALRAVANRRPIPGTGEAWA